MDLPGLRGMLSYPVYFSASPGRGTKGKYVEYFFSIFFVPVGLVAALAVFVLNVTFVFTGDGVQFFEGRNGNEKCWLIFFNGMMSQMELSECRR